MRPVRKEWSSRELKTKKPGRDRGGPGFYGGQKRKVKIDETKIPKRKQEAETPRVSRRNRKSSTGNPRGENKLDYRNCCIGGKVAIRLSV